MGGCEAKAEHPNLQNPMNRAEIIQYYNLTPITQTDDFKRAYREIRALIDNKSRAYERLIDNGETIDRRAVKVSTRPSVESAETD